MNHCAKIFRTRFRCQRFAVFGLKAKKKKGSFIPEFNPLFDRFGFYFQLEYFAGNYHFRRNI
jgi:hypothetical protein